MFDLKDPLSHPISINLCDAANGPLKRYCWSLLWVLLRYYALLSVNGASSMAETTLFSLTIARFHQSFQSNPRCPRKVLNWNCNCRNQKGSDKFNLFSQIARSTKIRICVLLRIFAYFCGLFAHFLRFEQINKKISKNRFKKTKHINNPSPGDQGKLLLFFPFQV